MAQFECQTGEEGALTRARDVYRAANKSMRNEQNKEERLLLLETWKAFEVDHTLSSLATIVVQSSSTVVIEVERTSSSSSSSSFVVVVMVLILIP